MAAKKKAARKTVKKKAAVEKAVPVGKGKLFIETEQQYRAPLSKVWDAATKAKHTSGFFVDKTTGDFGPELSTVWWYWKKWGTHPQFPVKYVKGKYFEFHWLCWKKKYMTTVRFTFSHSKGITKLKIKESGWIDADVKNALGNMEGWTTYLCYLKAYVLYGKDMRTFKG
jgi:uncharacterized protein YndB with AHSA1/START domain